MKNKNFYKACYLLITSIFTICAMDFSEIDEIDETMVAASAKSLCKGKGRNFDEDLIQVHALWPSHPIIDISQTTQLLRDIYGTKSVDIARFMADYAGFSAVYYYSRTGYSANLAKLMAICYNKMDEVDSLKAVLNALPQNPKEEVMGYDDLGEGCCYSTPNTYWRAQCVKDFLATAETEHFDKRIRAFARWSSIDRYACYEFKDIDSCCLTEIVINGLYTFLGRPGIDRDTFIRIFKNNNHLLNEAFFSRIPEVSFPLFSLVRTRGTMLNRDDELAALAANISQVVQVLSDDQIAILFPADVIARVRSLPIRGQTYIFERLATSPEYRDKASFNILLMSSEREFLYKKDYSPINALLS